MNEDTTLQRLIYYKGQLLTAQDFEDQQKYHKQKLEQLTQRFPIGIVRGLNVVISSDKDGTEVFLIEQGLAIDAVGNAIVVPTQGLRMPVDQFQSDKPYLSLKYTESKTHKSQSPCEDSKHYNRINEGVEVTWETAPNISDPENKEARITVARIRPKTDADKSLPAEVLGSKHVIEGAGDLTIRLDAGLIGEAQLDENVKNKLVIGGNGHDHADGDGDKIPLNGLADEVKEKLNSIPENIDERLVTEGDNHDHTEGSGGSKIPLAGLADDVHQKLDAIPDNIENSLVTGGDDHNHTEGHGDKIPFEGLDPAVQKRLVTINPFPINGTFSTANVNPDIPPFNDEKFRIPNVIPISVGARLSWSFEIERLASGVKYHFTIQKTPAGDETSTEDDTVIEYRIDFAEFEG